MSYDFILFFFFFFFFAVFCGAREQDKEKGTHLYFYACVALPLGRRNSSDPMAYASAPASELALQLSAPANSLAVPPPAASTAEAVDLSPGAAILEDPGPAATRTRVQRLSFTRYFLLLHTCECVTCFVL